MLWAKLADVLAVEWDASRSTSCLSITWQLALPYPNQATLLVGVRHYPGQSK
jgi:hypothetical protein